MTKNKPSEALVEAMARAIYEADDPWHVVWPWPDLQSDQAGVDHYRRCAEAAAAVIADALAERDAEIARLREDNEGLREMLRVVEQPDQQLCCSGYECGCQGATVGQYAAWAFKDTAAAAKDAARYQWLRDCSCPPHNFYISVPDEFAGTRYAPDDVDAYIDLARAALGSAKV